MVQGIQKTMMKFIQGPRKSNLDISGLSESFNLENPSKSTGRRYDRYDRELDDTEAIQNETG